MNPLHCLRVPSGAALTPRLAACLNNLGCGCMRRAVVVHKLKAELLGDVLGFFWYLSKFVHCSTQMSKCRHQTIYRAQAGVDESRC